MSTLFHVGYPKTGSSWIQQHVFEAHPGVDMPLSYKDAIGRFRFEHERLFWAPARLGALQETLAGPKQAVVSNENLVGGRFDAGLVGAGIARRLHAADSQGKVWIQVRRQETMALSLYAQAVRNGYTRSLKAFLDPVAHLPAQNPLQGFLSYDWLVRTYQDLFGKDNVLVTPFESFVADPDALLERVRGFAGLDASPTDTAPDGAVKRSLSAPALAVLRRVNALWGDPRNPHAQALFHLRGRGALTGGLERIGGRRRSQRAQRRVAAWCEGRFEASNQELAKITGIDLAGLGYAV